jgi:hypothetical protein
MEGNQKRKVVGVSLEDEEDNSVRSTFVGYVKSILPMHKGFEGLR